MFLPSSPKTSEISAIKIPLYDSSAIAEMLMYHDTLGLQRTAIFTDIHESWDSWSTHPQRKALDTICRNCHIPRIALTGYSLDNELREHTADHTSFFDILVSSGGTRIDLRHKDQSDNEVYVQDTYYEKSIIQTTQWDKEYVLSETKKLIERYHVDYPNRQFKFQKENGGTEKYRIGYHFFAYSIEERNDMQESIRSLFPQIKVVVADDRGYNAQFALDNWPRKFCLDITAANKLDAANYLINTLHIKTGIAVGNATNDLDFMLYTPSLIPVLVGGSTIDAQTIIHNSTIKQDNESFFVTLQTKPYIYKQAYVENDMTQIASQSVIHVISLLAQNALSNAISPQLKLYLVNIITELEEILRKPLK